jgi:dolichol-phosphate mannosyltransferase
VKVPLLSIVIPLLNEATNLIPLYDELKEVASQLTHFKNFEFLFVNDGSWDCSLDILKRLALGDARVKIISFIRNFGHENATYAGIHHAAGDAVVIIDADRQDPAELILAFERHYLDGYDIAYGQRTKRINETWLKKSTSTLFYPLFKKATNVDMPSNTGDFCLLSRRAINTFKLLPENQIFVRGLIYWSGLRKIAVPFIRRSRASGQSKYNYTKLTIFALENIISFSTLPMYLLIFCSALIIILCLFGGLAALIMKLLGLVILTGWTSLMLALLFLFSCNFLALGVLGLYIGKIFQELKRRPMFVVDELIGIEPNPMPIGATYAYLKK